MSVVISYFLEVPKLLLDVNMAFVAIGDALYIPWGGYKAGTVGYEAQLPVSSYVGG